MKDIVSKRIKKAVYNIPQGYEARIEGNKVIVEAKENEDERTWIINYLNNRILNSTIIAEKENLKKAIAWLEKQGEQKPNYCHHEVDFSGCSEEYRKAYYDGWNNCNMQHSQCKSELDDVVKCLINGMKFYYEDNEEATWGTDKWSMPVKHIIEVLEKQGEQKPAEKVEPKFKAGDWILHCGTEKIYQVVGIKDNKYQMECNGNYTEEKIADVNRCARKWDITKDAKDGDVLVSPPLGDDKGGVQIFMFKMIDNRCYLDNCIEFYNRICDGVFYENEEGYYMGTTSSPVYPATKEQRDLFFKKMHEAGFEWDAERKQLKKLIKK